MKQNSKGWTVLCDFDGTITELDMCLALLEEYAVGDWQSLDLAYDEGQITLEECLIGQVPMLAAPKELLADYARREGRLRPGFSALVAFCREQGVEFAVVSAGLDFYIDAILERESLGGLRVHYIRTTEAEGRMSVDLPLAGYELSAEVHDFKEFVVRQRQAEGLRVAFIGDGSTDIAAARQADHVFARAKLLGYCQREGLAHTPFEDFHTVRAGLARLLAERE